MAPFLEALGCVALLVALPGTAHADNCSDPPRLQSNGTFSAPGPDCSRTEGFKTGTKVGDVLVRGGVVTIYGVFAIRFLHGHGQLGYVKQPDGSRSLVVRPGSALDRYLRGDHSKGVLDELRRLDPRFQPGGELLVRPHGQGPLHPGGVAPDGLSTTRHETIGGKDVLVITPGTAIQVDLDAASRPPSTPPAESSPPVPSPSAEAAPPASDSTPPDSPAPPAAAPAPDPVREAREAMGSSGKLSAEEYEQRLKEQWKRAYREMQGKPQDDPAAARYRALEEALYGGHPQTPEMHDPSLKAAKTAALNEIAQELAEQRRQQDIEAGKAAREVLGLLSGSGPGPSPAPRPPGGQ